MHRIGVLNAAVTFVIALIMPSLSAEYVEHVLDGELSGVIQSPGFPSTYPENQNISWIIKVREGYRIELYFTEFDLEDSYDIDLGGPCVYDYVTIHDGDKLKAKFCGNQHRYPGDAPRIKEEIFSTENKMVLNFVTDYSNEDPQPLGFKAHYSEIDRDECWELRKKAMEAFEDWDTILYCNQHCNNVPSSYYCSCDPGYKLHENKHTCTSDCAGKVMKRENGEISTSLYLGKYSKLAECDWTIQQREGIAIDLKFVGDFAIEKHEDEGCVYDYVEYENAKGVKSERFCGTEKPVNGGWIFTNSHKVVVRFRSDLILEESGFKLEYKTTRVKCPYKPNAPQNGQITSTIEELYEFEDVVTFQCNRGYRMVGNERITCKSDATWSEEEPKCLIKHCKRPEHLESAANGRINEKSFELSYATEVTFLCYIWYELTSGTSVWRCEDDEQWHEASLPVANNANRNIPKCEPICGLKGNKQILSGTYNFGDVIPNDEDKGNLLSPFIIGGKEAKEAEWPWVVFIDLYGWGAETIEFCGGSLLSPNTVVTAAHCTQNVLPKNIRVFVGMTDRENLTKHVQEFSVSEVNEHETFDHNTFDNDIAVLKLNASVTIGKFARPICLPRSRREIDLPMKALEEKEGFHKTGVIAGWGITETGHASLKLKMARIPPIKRSDCKKNLNLDTYGIGLTDNMLCGGFLNNERDSCQGDSGGPFMFKDKAQSRYILNGLVSFGSSEDSSCGEKTFGIYTDVAKYVPWLESFLTDY